ncbi:MAG: hypothetical protein AB7H90_07355 [Alphaproteobacteria bacterium]
MADRRERARHSADDGVPDLQPPGMSADRPWGGRGHLLLRAAILI